MDPSYKVREKELFKYIQGFTISEEKDFSSDKDTSRLLASGASKVFWLKSRENFLLEGFEELLKEVDSDSLIICESNSLRKFVVPGLFLIVSDKNSDVFKPSSSEVIKFSDRIISLDGKNYDFDISTIRIEDGRWTI